MIVTIAKWIAVVLLFVVVGVGLAVTIVPKFLDRVYYRGPVSSHFDGERFFNPEGDDDTARPPSGGSRSGFFWRYLTGNDGRPKWPTQVEVAQAQRGALLPPYGTPIQFRPASAEEVATTPMVATWIGHASVLVQTPGLNILTDPVWSERAGPFGFGPKRVTRPGITLDALPKIDVVLISHNHYDHMDLATLKRLWDRDRPLIVTSLGNDAILRSKGIGATAADWGGAVTVEGRTRVGEGSYWTKPARVIVTRNHHWGSRWFSDRNRALWSSFVVELPGGNLFFAGDTGFSDGSWADEAARLGPIRLALIPIGAFRFMPGQMGSGSHMGPVDAVEAYRRLGAGTAIPIHWGTFRLSYEAYDTPPKLLAATQECTGQRGFDAVPMGIPQAVPPYAPPRPVAPMTRDALLKCLDTPEVRALP